MPDDNLTFEELKENYERYRSLIKLSPDPIVVFSDSKLVFINDAAIKLLGAKNAQDILGRNIMDFVHPDFREIVSERIKLLLAGQQVGNIEEKFVRLDGEIVDVEVASSLISYKGQKAVIVIGRDITERKKAEKERELLTKRIQLLLESTDQGIYGLDENERCFLFNKAASKMTGYKSEEVIGRNIHDLIHHTKKDGSAYPASECPIIIAFKKGKGIRADDEIFWRKDGSSFPVEYSSYPIIEDGKIEGAVVTFTDISERKKAEEAIKKSEANYRTIFNAVNDAIFVHDIDTGRIIDVNQKMTEMYGYTSEEAKKLSIEDLSEGISPFDQKSALEYVKKAARGEPQLFEWRARTKNGRLFWVEVNLKRAVIGDEVRLLAVVRDISERKEVEEELQKERELSDALNEINAAIISKLELDTILRVATIKGAKALKSETAAACIKENGRWVVRHLYGFKEELRSRILAKKYIESPLRLAATLNPVVISDVLGDVRINKKFIGQFKLKSLMIIPLLTRDGIIGMILFMQNSSKKIFSESEIGFAVKLGASTSLALQNARLYEAEKNIADTLQEALLTIPEHIENLEYGHIYRSATETARVGGDFYDLFEIEHGKVGVILGDVSGKGIEAAALTSIVRNTIRAYAVEGYNPSEVVRRTNDVVVSTTELASFVTIFFGIIEIETGKLTYCSAGHPPAIIMRSNNDVIILKVSSFVVGAFSNIEYKEDVELLKPGDIVILYTDGLIEARRGTEFFGEERLINKLRELKDMSATNLPQKLYEEVLDFTGGALSDDLAILALSLV